MRVLGIDPGTRNLGYAILEKKLNNIYLLESGVLKLSKIKDQYNKLKEIYYFVDNIIKKYNIEQISIESVFYGENIQSMFKLGRVHGCIITCALNNNIKITEFSPREIKLSITGNGNASKEQVKRFIPQIISLNTKKMEHDESDAIAIGITIFFKQNRKENKNKDWFYFIKNNPNRIK